MTRPRVYRGLCVFALGCSIIAPQATAAECDQAHARFTDVLRSVVKDARVNYAALKAHSQDLNRFQIRYTHYDWSLNEQGN